MSDSLQPHGLHAVGQVSLSIANSWSFLKLMSIESVRNPTISSSVIPFPPDFNFSQHQGLFKESVLCIRWPKYWNFSFSISPSNEYSGLISWPVWSPCSPRDSWVFSNTTGQKHQFLWHSTFFMVQLSHPYLTTGKTIALTRWTFVCKVMSLLFNMLSRLVTASLPRSKHLLISRRQSLSAVILKPKKVKSITVSILSPSICHEVMALDPMILVFWTLSFKPSFSLSSFTFI